MKYLLYLPINILWMFICYIFNPIVILFTKEDGNLPKCLYWFQTHDQVLFFTDEWVQDKWPFLVNVKPEWLKLYLCRLFWLYRNTGYAFAYEVLGYDVDPTTVVTKGTPGIGNLDGKSGWVFYYDAAKPIWNRCWCLYTALQWGSLPICFQAYLGWKMGHAVSSKQKQRAMLAMRINPVMSFKIKE